MNTIKYLFFAVLLMVLNVSCEKEYSAPPLNEPKYTGKLENISIAQLKQRYAKITTPELIQDDLIIKAIVTGNDESGNIYKQIYVQDASAAINIGVDQNATYAAYQIGQEVYIHLKELYVVKYGGELQIGMGSTNANRVSWEMFKAKTFSNSWPKASNAVPLEVELGALTDDMVHKLIEIKNVSFTNGGKAAYTTGDNTTNQQLKDAAGKSIDVRTSNFSDFAKDMLPTGSGTIIGILGRFNGGWQLMLRTKGDAKDFNGTVTEPEKPQAGTFFKETFGTGTYPSGNRPKLAEFTDFDMKAPIKYTDESGLADIRSVTGDNGAFIWLPAARDVNVKVTGINLMDKGDVTMTFQLAANLFDVGSTANINNIQLKVNGTTITLPNQVLTNAADNGKFYTISIPNIPKADNLTLEFISTADLNKVGFRLDNIQLVGASTSGGGTGAPVIVTPK